LLDQDLSVRQDLRFVVVPASPDNAPIFHLAKERGFYFASIGSLQAPLLLELRFVSIPVTVQQVPPVGEGR
jgi:hypothetical protein